MDEKKVISGILLDETTTISYIEVCEKYEISEEFLKEMIEHGLFNAPKNIKHWELDYPTVTKIQSAQRLHQDLEVNVPGIVLILELLDEMEELKQKLNILQRHVDGP